MLRAHRSHHSVLICSRPILFSIM
uniref:Uncharacterized protein n=1 Tax=Arundo donax TaxID=35708 RepID=A0A0A9GHZ8_ARUDO